MACGCIACREAALEEDARLFNQEERFHRYLTGSWFRYACEICGNKRCPHHSDHRLACTNSNEPGQPGSIYVRSDHNDDDG